MSKWIVFNAAVLLSASAIAKPPAHSNAGGLPGCDKELNEAYDTVDELSVALEDATNDLLAAEAEISVLARRAQHQDAIQADYIEDWASVIPGLPPGPILSLNSFDHDVSAYDLSGTQSGDDSAVTSTDHAPAKFDAGSTPPGDVVKVTSFDHDVAMFRLGDSPSGVPVIVNIDGTMYTFMLGDSPKSAPSLVRVDPGLYNPKSDNRTSPDALEVCAVVPDISTGADYGFCPCLSGLAFCPDTNDCSGCCEAIGTK